MREYRSLQSLAGAPKLKQPLGGPLECWAHIGHTFGAKLCLQCVLKVHSFVQESDLTDRPMSCFVWDLFGLWVDCSAMRKCLNLLENWVCIPSTAQIKAL